MDPGGTGAGEEGGTAKLGDAGLALLPSLVEHALERTVVGSAPCGLA